jgi:hypothetical protein
MGVVCQSPSSLVLLVSYDFSKSPLPLVVSRVLGSVSCSSVFYNNTHIRLAQQTASTAQRSTTQDTHILHSICMRQLTLRTGSVTPSLQQPRRGFTRGAELQEITRCQH